MIMIPDFYLKVVTLWGLYVIKWVRRLLPEYNAYKVQSAGA